MLNSTLSDKGAFRVKDWWWSKAALMMGMVYLFTAWFEIPLREFPVLALLSITTIIGFASFGYLVNDLFDIEKDTKAGKKNFLAGKPTSLIVLFFLLSGSLMLYPWGYFENNRYSGTMIITELVLFIIYSAPPIRLKERGVWGLIVDALYAHALPVVLISYTYSLEGNKVFPLAPVLLLFIWQMLNGIRNILLHQADDMQTDKNTNVKNFVSRISSDSFRAAIQYLIAGELIFSCSFFLILFFNNRLFTIYLLVTIGLSAIAYYLFGKKRIGQMLKSGWKFFPNNIYEKWLPACNLLILAQIHTVFYAVLLLHLAIFNFDFYVQTFKTLYPLLRDVTIHGIIIGRKTASYLINHFIYYLLLVFGVDLKKEKTSAAEYFKKRWGDDKRNEALTTVSSGNKNQQKRDYEDYWKKWRGAATNVLNQPSASNSISRNIFVFVVCGTQEHIDALHYSLRALKQVSKNPILVITDSSRNEIPVIHDWIADVKTPGHFNHHQASVFIKTAIHRFLPKGNNYCYLDTDVVALDSQVDEIFNQFIAPITFAPDHCLMDKFSPSAVKCGCIDMYGKWVVELRGLFKKYKHLTRQPEDEGKKERLLKYFEEIKKNKVRYALITLRFWLSPFKFTLHEDAILDKRKHAWFDNHGNAILYERVDNAITVIESTTDYRCDKVNRHLWTIHGHNVFDCRCNHLQEQIDKTFGIKVTDPKWQHWNGGVFLFNEQSHAFLDSWHEKTMQIFENPDWKTRDQGTLIATAWEFNLQNHTTLPYEFNLIADYHHLTMVHKGNLLFDVNEQHKDVRPHFIHVYHHWADKNWDVWRDVEKATGIFIEPESDTINALWIGSRLSPLELLTIHSFLDNGHKFRLWLYDTLENDLPPGVETGDASTIIPASEVFSYKNQNTFGHGKGSYAGFSDIFRYKLLYEYGGWWVDMDITCLKSFDFDKQYFFRSHHELKVVGNVMKCPKHSKVMQLCFEEAAASVNEHNTDWHKPIDILNKHIVGQHLEGYIYKNVSNEDHWDITSRYLWNKDVLPDNWYFVHWQNEEWRSKKVSKKDFYYRSALAGLLCKYKLAAPPITPAEKIINTLKHSKYFRHLFNDTF